ncbi:ribosome biogenesis GTP-binding protein YihA/YsxC [Leptospira ilyithenensis]|uniref:Probable GTP-binding protein EngB n=1 Tax=Leptospira ilyithenensis TaxID=2484901 RepID=A0A4R9LNR6_9LEPT|nr:ribosome biogenesis GTP-binding protein YihA/YsxC [Leptospira ilyithenensis]TGN06871.1 YihA family ribosome biogenesis GTP-binding protein [Leptospira ilyithenensis]
MNPNKPIYHEEVPFPETSFSTSISKISPETPLPEGTLLGFIGRSNSGKSSLLNSITNRKGLAKVSKTPGKTRLINVFSTKAGFSLIDLPGFGYSKASHKEHKDMMNLLDQFLNEITSLKVLFILCDAQRSFPEEEVQMIETATLKKILPVVVRTKIDKLNQKDRNAIQKEMEAVMNELGYPFPLFFVSATTGKGIGEMRKFILSKVQTIPV